MHFFSPLVRLFMSLEDKAGDHLSECEGVGTWLKGIFSLTVIEKCPSEEQMRAIAKEMIEVWLRYL